MNTNGEAHTLVLLQWLPYIAFSTLIAKIIWIVTWRLWFHPLASIPGPRLAAICGLWEVWQDIGQDGNLPRAVAELHRKYNTDIIRISPNHVHIDNPEFYFQIFKVNTDFHKDRGFYERMAVPQSLLTVDTKTARSLRSKANPILAPRDWGSLADEAQSITKKASDQLLAQSRGGENVEILFTLRCISTDIICNLSFGFIPDFVTRLDEGKKLFNVLDITLEGFWYMIHIPFLMTPAFVLPTWILKLVMPAVIHFREQGGAWVDRALNPASDTTNSSNPHQSTLMGLLNPFPGKKPDHATREWLIDQANTLVFAGVDTTAVTLVYTFHQILSSPDICRRLQEELRDATPIIRTCFDWRKVRQLPYLSAVIKEGLRLGASVPGRLPRVVPPQGLQHRDRFIPGGMIVSSNIYSMHHNPSVFPSPDTFNPDRWLADDSIELEKYNVAFSKGSRSCIGMNLAYLELYTVLAVFFNRFDLQLEESTAGRELAWSDRFAKAITEVVKVRVLKDHWEE
ncbi:cytochrome P450 [Penicillium capsulatum]|uniref:Cytochrome P450 n=1 Tax=Penicillium capsulatum TaxID=69766 RepID=A0A9W9I1S8_9EURO|nr:cytochrome P450 [Penicillium capsulatum]KAJ6117563.1 cytochrome P450 [Penicillium capsulatum]